MGKIGVITDAHGNLAATTAILNYLDELGCDEIIHTGDVVDIGPCSRECLELLLSRDNVTLLLGNHDRDFALNEYTARKLSHVPTEHKKQVFETMTDELREKVSRFPLYTARKCGKDTLLFCHYAFKQQPFDITKYPFWDIVNPPTAEDFDRMFDGQNCQAVFFGHKHEPCDVVGKRLYVDVGSVGCHPEPYARGVVIEYDDNTWSYKRVTAPYDMDATRVKLTKETACGEQLYDFYFMLNFDKNK